jgi:hypothetical protein
MRDSKQVPHSDVAIAGPEPASSGHRGVRAHVFPNHGRVEGRRLEPRAKLQVRVRTQ